MPILVLLNNFAHDFSAAGWIFGTVLLWSIMKKKQVSGDALRVINEILKTVLNLMRICFIGIILFGVIRAMAYTKFEWNEAAGSGQVTLLIVKHILFLGIVVPGCIAYLKARKMSQAGVQ